MINSLSNTRVKKWVKLKNKKYRLIEKLFIIEEKHLIEEANNANLLDTIIILENVENIFNFDKIEYVSKEIMKKLSSNTSLNQYIGIAKFPDNNRVNSNRILLLDDIQNPGNMGTILRSAYSFGFNKVLVSKGCVDITNEKVVQSSQGAIFYLDIQEVDLIEYIQESDFPIYATGFENSVELKTISKSEKLGIVLGNEGNGVRKEIMKCCDKIINVEMKNFDSLNVGIAAGICMYELQEEM